MAKKKKKKVSKKKNKSGKKLKRNNKKKADKKKLKKSKKKKTKKKAKGKRKDEPNEGRYYALGKSKIYHVMTCWVVGDVSTRKDIKGFFSAAIAKKAGYRPCSRCENIEK